MQVGFKNAFSLFKKPLFIIAGEIKSERFFLKKASGISVSFFFSLAKKNILIATTPMNYFSHSRRVGSG